MRREYSTVQIDHALHNELKKLSIQTGRSITFMVGKAVEKYIKESKNHETNC